MEDRDLEERTEEEPVDTRDEHDAAAALALGGTSFTVGSIGATFSCAEFYMQNVVGKDPTIASDICITSWPLSAIALVSGFFLLYYAVDAERNLNKKYKMESEKYEKQ